MMWGGVEILSQISILAGAFGIASGALLLLVPGALREGSRWRHWLLETDLVALLDTRRMIERSLYRHHRVFGAVVIAGALTWFATLWVLRDRLLVQEQYPGTVTLAVCALAAFALGIGVFLVIRPSALKGLEKLANRWIEPFSSASKFGGPGGYAIVNRLVLRAPRVAGALLLGAGLGCLALSR